MAKIGAGHAQAMMRLGLAELRAAFNPSRESVAATEIGLYGTATQMDVNNTRSDPGQGFSLKDLKSAVLEQRDKDGPDRSREMEM